MTPHLDDTTQQPHTRQAHPPRKIKGTPVGLVYGVLQGASPALGSWEDQPPAAYEVLLGCCPQPWTTPTLSPSVVTLFINVVPVHSFRRETKKQLEVYGSSPPPLPPPQINSG
eukprot:3076210-Pyramimonas_sp.AAC.1